MRCRTVSRPLTPLAALIAFAPLVITPARADGPEPDISPELREALQDFLKYDFYDTTKPRRISPLRKPAQQPSGLDGSRNDNKDGSAAVSVKKPLPLPVEVSVGADFGLAGAPAQTFQPDRPIQSAKDPSSGAAWANVSVVPGLASVDARVDPGKERRFGTTLGYSVPFGQGYSITLQNSYAVTETQWGGHPGGGGSTALPPAQFWTNDRLVKFNILSTGTSLAAGTTNSSVDNITRNKFSAEQKLFQNFNVTTSVTDLGGASANKSITAGFKLKW